ncbi:M14 family zinc carboxypeptidase, partial [Myxococcota bacterium]
DLKDQYPDLVTYQSIGTSYLAKELPVFSLGNPEGGKILFIGCTHGSEVDGPEVYYYMARWLLERQEPIANRILQRNLVSFLIYNVDSYGLKRKNQQLWGHVAGEPELQYGVDLNRNMPNGWATLDHASQDPVHNNYHGPSATSEPESQALLQFFETHNPRFVLDYHMGMDNWFAKPSRHAEVTTQDRAYHDQIAQQVRSLQGDRDVRVMSYGTLGISGSVASQAYVSAGATAFLFEDGKANSGYPYPPTHEEIESTYMPKTLPFLLVFAEESELGTAIESFTLIDADSDTPIGSFDPLTDGSVLNLSTLPTTNLNIRANTAPATVGSVKFGLDNDPSYHTESFVPYAMANENNGDFDPWTPSLGTHTLTATPFSQADGVGSAGAQLTISFEVVADCTDTDSDGYGSPASVGCLHDELDCDDEDAAVNPGASEVCDIDNIDEDCDGVVDDADDSATGKTLFYADGDSDGFGWGSGELHCDPPIGWVENDEDCDDSDAGTNPDASETCNENDDDCDGETDEDFDLQSTAEHCGTCNHACTSTQHCTGGTCVSPCPDDDGDGHANADCGGTDCDDNDALISPDAAEICHDQVDNDCNGLSDEDCVNDSPVVGGCTAGSREPGYWVVLLGLIPVLRRRHSRSSQVDKRAHPDLTATR